MEVSMILFPFIKFYTDGTEVMYSEIIKQDGIDYVRVYFKRWNTERNEFDSMECLLPDGNMEKIIGFSDMEADYHHSRMISLQDMILECSQEDTEKNQTNGSRKENLKDIRKRSG